MIDIKKAKDVIANYLKKTEPYAQTIEGLFIALNIRKQDYPTLKEKAETDEQIKLLVDLLIDAKNIIINNILTTHCLNSFDKNAGIAWKYVQAHDDFFKDDNTTTSAPVKIEILPNDSPAQLITTTTKKGGK